MENINSIISAYLAAKAEESAAKKRAAALKEKILQHAGSAPAFNTDEWNVIIKRSISIRIDTAKLYADFGEQEIKSVYGYESESVTVNAAAVKAAETKSA